jgi:hypothetical protein
MTAKQRGRQKKAEKHRKKREQVRKAARKSEWLASTRSLVRLASAAPFGPCWVSSALEAGEEAMPSLITVVVTRNLPGGLLLPHVILVDRTCLGVKNALVAQPMDEDTVLDLLIRRPEMPMSPCDLLVAQSVVYHAIDYARSLGFEPHRDFHPALIGKRPERLLDTPLAKPERPCFIAGPSDDAGRIMRQLERAVGTDFDLAVGDDFPGGEEETPEEDVLDGLDLSSWADRHEAVGILASMLERREFLRWEAVVREERGLPLSDAQATALGELMDFTDDHDSPILYIDDCARPTEPWYESVRRVAAVLVLDRYETAATHYDEETTLGARLLDVVEQHAKDLSLPKGCNTPVEVVPGEVRHRLRVQCAFDALGGIGQDGRGPVATLADPEERHRIDWFAKALRDNAGSLDALGWTLDDLLGLVVMPKGEQDLLVEGLKDRGFVTSTRP